MKPSPFIEQVRSELRTRHYSLRTEKTYLYWIRHFLLFNDKRHPESMDISNIEHFLNYLAVQRRVGASSQNQALCALIFMYRHVIKRDIENLQYCFAKRPKNMPTVLSPQEISSILNQLKGKYWLMTALLYGCGFRIH
jgi:site-specific recombinase XerD